METEEKEANWPIFTEDMREAWEKFTAKYVNALLGLKDWLIFTEDMREAWEESTAKYVNALLELKDKDSLTVKIELPEKPTLPLKNETLKGTITLSREEESAEIPVVLPYHGVFFIASHKQSTPLFEVWNSWLGEAIGVRHVIPTSHEKRTKYYSVLKDTSVLEWRIGLPGGNFLNVAKLAGGNDDVSSSQKVPTAVQDIINRLDQYPEGLKEAVNKKGATWADVLNACNKSSEQVQPSDADDLEHRVLMTFPVWLKYQLGKKLSALKNQDEKKKSASENPDKKKKRALKNLDDLWSDEALRKRLGNSLVPVSPNPKRGDTDGTRGLVYVEPKNILDLASRITRVKRINMSRRAMEEIPEEFRQNHSSFMGRLCPVESPESELVGLSLQLAQGATIDENGKIRQSPEKYLQKLGYGAGLVPFFPHNDGTRNMMAAKNLRQALPIVGREAPIVKTGGEEQLTQFMSPLADLGIFPESTDDDEGDKPPLALGKDLLVAYLPWYGWNMEDAIVVSDEVLDAFAIQGVKRHYSRPQPSGTSRDTFLEDEGFKNGLREVGQSVVRGDIIANFICGGKKFSVKYDGDTPGEIVSISYSDPKNPFEQGVLEYTLEEQIPLMTGDKLMGRHGNKGVVGKILPKDKMPKLPDGTPIQVLLNPHGVISRMNIGQLLETHIGWLLKKGVKEKNLLQEGKGKSPIGYPQVDALDLDKIKTLLGENDALDENGRVYLTLPNDKKTASPVLVGYEHMVRLAHIPMKKVQARGTGRYNSLTGQAVHGRRQGGGQRIGEMEVWALNAYGANHILNEMLGNKSFPPKTESLPEGIKWENFPLLLKNWLRMMLVDCIQEGDKLKLSKLDTKKFIKGAVEVTSDETFVFGTTADYTCKNCESELYPYGDWTKRIQQYSQRQKPGNNPSLKLGSLLNKVGFKDFSIENTQTTQTAKETTTTFELSGNVKNTSLKYQCILEETKTSSKLEMKAVKPETWGKDYESLKEIYCYKNESRKNASLSIEWLKDLFVTCPKHHTTKLQATKVIDPAVPDPKSGGLYDEKIFGKYNAVPTWSTDQEKWGYIQLPDAPEGYTMPKGMENLKGITIIPVPPIRMRKPRRKGNTMELDDLDTKGYLPLLQARKKYVSSKNTKDYTELLKCLRNPDYPKKKGKKPGLFQLLEERLKGKNGLIRHEGLGRRVDYSARMVITPNPDLNWEEVKVPTHVLWELMGRIVLDELDKTEQTQNVQNKEPLDELRKEDSRAFRSAKRSINRLQLQYELLTKYLGKHSDTLVLLNRQPSLHRYSFHALKPIPIDPNNEAERQHLGEVIQLSPLVCNDFGADFDGDEMVLHFPLSNDAQKEAQRLRFCNNLVSLATGAPTAHYTQDFKMGTFWLLKNPKPINDLCDAFNELLTDSGIPLPKGTDPKKRGEQLLEQVSKMGEGEKAAGFISDWLRLALEACTRMGVSFGFFDFKNDKLNLDGIDWTDIQNLNGTLEGRITPELPAEMDATGLHVNGMVLSGARGKKEQLRQIQLARGYLEAGNLCEYDPNNAEIKKEKFVFQRSLMQGLDFEDAFYAAMNARKSMCDKKLGTGKAGAISRTLVFALWPYVIQKKEEEEKYVVRSIISQKDLCDANDLFKEEEDQQIWKMIQAEMGKNINQDFPIGLLAAQSIGERGTQLSMQSFHTGTGATDIKSVSNHLNGKDANGNTFRYEPKKSETSETLENAFVNSFKGWDGKKFNGPYKEIRNCYFRLLWRVMNDVPEENATTDENASATSKKVSLNRTLAGAIQRNCEANPLTGIAYQKQWENLKAAKDNKDKELSLDSPIAKVLFNLF